MSKNEERNITMNQTVLEPTGIIDMYSTLCVSGLRTGALVGGYIGGTIGFTTAVASPGILMYGLFRVAKKMLR
jgi:hypothetical protein